MDNLVEKASGKRSSKSWHSTRCIATTSRSVTQAWQQGDTVESLRKLNLESVFGRRASFQYFAKLREG
jgi:hypothetical protein